MRKTTAREAPFPSPSSELSLPLSTVSEPQSSSSSSSSLEEDSSCQRENLKNISLARHERSNLGKRRSLSGCPLTPDPFLMNLLASDEGSGFFFKKDLAVTSSPPSPSLSDDEPATRIRLVQLQLDETKKNIK